MEGILILVVVGLGLRWQTASFILPFIIFPGGRVSKGLVYGFTNLGFKRLL
ncbi:hypothetical protein [Peribacillus sp. SCS-155]|uniref:hypothetical protein n=1 Tax=Peribacillus sedimenti TaxID=3115297 RepID=UPI0039069DB1